MKKTVLLFFIFCASLHAQSFLKQGNKNVTFKDIQRQFYDFKRSVRDLQKVKYWKYFKRWEYETQFRCTSDGEPADGREYIQEVLRARNVSSHSTDEKNSVSPWAPVGPNVVPQNNTGYMENGIGRYNCIAFHPTNPQVFFVGVAQGGVWKTTNNGLTWAPLTDNLPVIRVSDIAIDPVNPNTMYISLCDFEYIGFGLHYNGRKRHTHYGLGVYKTTDGGTTWTPTGLSFQLTNGDASLIRKIIVNPANTNQLLACGTSGMYKSYNGGVTWTKILDSLFWDMVQVPSMPNVIYAATGYVKTTNEGYAAIYKSTDFGSTWTLLNTGIPGTGAVQRVKLAIAPSDPNYIYAITVDMINGLYGFYKSTNAGATWQFIPPSLNILDWYDGTGTGGQGNYDLVILVDKQDKNKVYAGGINLWGSTDGCNTWNPITYWTYAYGPSIHADIHDLAQHPITNEFYCCTDGGLYRTSNLVIHSWAAANNNIPWPTQWTNLSNGLNVTSFYKISSSKNSKGRLAAGAQDNATFYYDGISWSTVIGGDGMDNYLDPLDDNHVIGSAQYGNFYASYDNGQTFYNLYTNLNNENAEWTTPIAGKNGTLYIGYENVVKSTDNGQTWLPTTSLGTTSNNEISALAISPSSPSVIYVAKRVRYELQIPGSFHKSTDGGNTWTNITTGLPDSLYFTDVDVHYNNPNIVYVSVAGFSNGNKVFMSTNGGQTWQNISYNLPNLPVNAVKNIPGTNHIMVGTDVGVYVLLSGSTQWLSQSTGLPNVIVSDIEFNQTLNKIYISTFGRGIWFTDLGTFVSLVENKTTLTDFVLFPSLNNGTFTLSLSTSTIQFPKTLEIIDIHGRIVHSEPLKSAKQKITASLSPGVYYARVSDEKSLGVKKFIVE